MSHWITPPYGAGKAAICLDCIETIKPNGTNHTIVHMKSGDTIELDQNAEVFHRAVLEAEAAQEISPEPPSVHEMSRPVRHGRAVEVSTTSLEGSDPRRLTMDAHYGLRNPAFEDGLIHSINKAFADRWDRSVPRDRKISRFQRNHLMRLFRNDPGAFYEAQQYALTKAAERGITTAGMYDWDPSQWIELLTAILPLILEFLRGLANIDW